MVSRKKKKKNRLSASGMFQSLAHSLGDSIDEISASLETISAKPKKKSTLHEIIHDYQKNHNNNNNNNNNNNMMMTTTTTKMNTGLNQGTSNDGVIRIGKYNNEGIQGKLEGVEHINILLGNGSNDGGNGSNDGGGGGNGGVGGDHDDDDDQIIRSDIPTLDDNEDDENGTYIIENYGPDDFDDDEYGDDADDVMIDEFKRKLQLKEKYMNEKNSSGRSGIIHENDCNFEFEDIGDMDVTGKKIRQVIEAGQSYIFNQGQDTEITDENNDENSISEMIPQSEEEGQSDIGTTSMVSQIRQNFAKLKNATLEDDVRKLLGQISILFDAIISQEKKNEKYIKEEDFVLKVFDDMEFLKIIQFCFENGQIEMASTIIGRYQQEFIAHTNLAIQSMPLFVKFLSTKYYWSVHNIFYQYSQSFPEVIIPYTEEIIDSVREEYPSLLSFIGNLYKYNPEKINSKLQSFVSLYEKCESIRSSILTLLSSITRTDPSQAVIFLPTLMSDLKSERASMICHLLLSITHTNPKLVLPFVENLHECIFRDSNMCSVIPDIYSMIVRSSKLGENEELIVNILKKITELLKGTSDHRSLQYLVRAVANIADKRPDTLSPELIQQIRLFINDIDSVIRDYAIKVLEFVDGMDKKNKNNEHKSKQGDNLKLKIEQSDGQMRMASIPKHFSYEQFLDKLSLIFTEIPKESIAISYVEDGDTNIVKSQDEWEELVSLYLSLSFKSLKCKLVVPSAIPITSQNAPGSPSVSVIRTDFISSHERLTTPSPSTRTTFDSSFLWKKGVLLGSGGFGKVYEALNVKTGNLMAVKQIPLPSKHEKRQDKLEKEIASIQQEIELMKKLDHKNIVLYLGTETTKKHLNIFLEFVSGGSLTSMLGKFGGFPETIIQCYLKQILSGLKYLHDNMVIHRDIKGANILVDDKGNIKLADFGASKVMELATTENAKHSLRGTPVFMAPEIITSGKFGIASDIWALGCTVIEMLTAKLPWSEQVKGLTPYQVMFKIANMQMGPPIPPTINISEELRDLIQKCVDINPQRRPTCDELLGHPFFLPTTTLYTPEDDNDSSQNSSSISEKKNTELEKAMTIEDISGSFMEDNSSSLSDPSNRIQVIGDQDDNGEDSVSKTMAGANIETYISSFNESHEFSGDFDRI